MFATNHTAKEETMDERELTEEQKALQKEMRELQIMMDPTLRPQSISSAALMEQDCVPVDFVVKGLFPKGLCILGGAPKIGKSWMVLDLCYHVAKGEPFLGLEVNQGTVWYLSYEDNNDRMKRRLACIGADGLDNFHISTREHNPGTMGNGLPETIDRFMRDLINYTCQLIRDSYRSPKVAETNLPNILARIERLNAQKETLLDMRAEGEITKEEYLHQTQKLETELLALMAEKDKLSKENTAEPEMPQWGKIQNALSQVLDLSQPKPDPDLVRKFVSKIIPDGKTTFHWYLNLDGNSPAVQTLMVEGRKNHAVVTVEPEEASSVTATVVHIMAIRTYTKEEIACLLGQLHRLLLRANI